MQSRTDIDLARGVGWAESQVGPVHEVRELSGGLTSTMLWLEADTGDSAVLRLLAREPWRSHGAALVTRERDIQQMLEGTGVPAPRSRALDADGRECGHPAHLMTGLPGEVDTARVDPASLGRLADVLSDIHAVSPDIEVRTYQSWAWEAKYAVPSWATHASLWQEAFDLLRSPPPAYEPCFIHRDFQPRNVLWSGSRVSGVVDWVETSVGPAWLDVAHCCTNLAITHGTQVADRFAAAYTARTGREPEPYFDVMDVVGFLPPPGRAGFLTADADRRRLEERLRAVVDRIG